MPTNVFAGIVPVAACHPDIPTSMFTTALKTLDNAANTTDGNMATAGGFGAGVYTKTGLYQGFEFTLPSPTRLSRIGVRYDNNYEVPVMSVLLDGVEYDESYATATDPDGWGLDSGGVDFLTFEFPLTEVTEVQFRRTWNNVDYCGAFSLYFIGAGETTLAITATPSSGVAPIAIDFSANLTGTSYQWDFGDGTTSTDVAPTHVYSRAGTFTVTLILDGETASTTVTVSSRVTALVEPVFTEVWIDWDDDGFGTASGDTDYPLLRLLGQGVTHNDDVTEYVRSVQFQRGGQFDLIGGQTPGRCTIVVRNDDGRWNDRNASGPYYGFLRPGLKVWVGMRDSDSPANHFGLFAGYLDEIVPVPGKNNRTAQLLVTDPFGFWQKVPVSVEFAENRTVKAFREAMLDSLGVPVVNRSLDDELEGLTASGGRADNALAILEDLNKSVGTRHWIEPAAEKDDFYFYMTLNRNRNLGFTYDDSLDDDDIIAMDGYRTTRETLVNQQRVEYSPVLWGSPTPEEVWKSAGPLPMRVGTTRFVVTFGEWVRELVVDTATFAAATGSVTVTNYGNEALVELIDLVSDNVCTSLILKGDKADSQTQQFYEAIDFASQAMYREKAGSPVTGVYIQNSAVAQAVGEAVVQRSKTPKSRPTVRMRNRYDKFLTNGLFSVVRQTVTELSLDDEQYEIVGLTGSITAGDTVRDWSWTYLGTTIASTDNYDIFTLDQSVLDGPDVLGF